MLSFLLLPLLLLVLLLPFNSIISVLRSHLSFFRYYNPSNGVWIAIKIKPSVLSLQPYQQHQLMERIHFHRIFIDSFVSFESYRFRCLSLSRSFLLSLLSLIFFILKCHLLTQHFRCSFDFFPTLSLISTHLHHLYTFPEHTTKAKSTNERKTDRYDTALQAM